MTSPAHIAVEPVTTPRVGVRHLPEAGGSR